MTTKRTKVRVHSEAELIRRIDRLTKLKRDRLNRADELDAKADKIYQNCKPNWPLMEDEEERAKVASLVAKAAGYRDKSIKLRSMHSTDKRLKMLGDKLAQLRTGTFGFMPDGSVEI